MTPEKMTPAKAAKLRRAEMEACRCWLCRYALDPPKTFEAQREAMEECARRNARGTWDEHRPALCAREAA